MGQGAGLRRSSRRGGVRQKGIRELQNGCRRYRLIRSASRVHEVALHILDNVKSDRGILLLKLGKHRHHFGGGSNRVVDRKNT